MHERLISTKERWLEMLKKTFFLFVLLLLAAGCSPQSQTGQNDQSPSSTSAPVTEVRDADDFVRLLRDTGATVELSESIEQPFFSVPGQIIAVNGHDVQVFVFESENARQVESGKISKDGSSIGTSMVSWVQPPHFWANGNAIILYVGTNQEVVDLINQVIGPSITNP